MIIVKTNLKFVDECNYYVVSQFVYFICENAQVRRYRFEAWMKNKDWHCSLEDIIYNLKTMGYNSRCLFLAHSLIRKDLRFSLNSHLTVQIMK